MAGFLTETVTHVHHWNDTLFSFRTTRAQGLRFRNGQFVMIGLETESRPIMRAYSIASANYEEEMEFFSIKVPDGALTSRLQKIQPGDQIKVSKKPTGTLLVDDLLPGRNLYLLSTGTGLAPFMSIIKDPETYERFDKVILTHGVRYVSELAYRDLILNELPNNAYFGEQVRDQLVYYPTVTREAFERTGRLTDLFTTGQLFSEVGLPEPNHEDDRFMICGSPSMLQDFVSILDARDFRMTQQGELGHYVIERAFVES
ncbi:MAG: ferredoxin--NADP reductase [Gammaproteobacteria bacterium]|nr:MAG: ferredoxin--NADP reductase [Gammaproteobacteria bacterium]